MSVDYARFFAALCGGNVEFILVGGTAANVHGSARLTQDVDIVYRRSRENVARLVAALGPFDPYLRGAPPGLPFRWDAETIWRGLTFTLQTALGPVDALGEILDEPVPDDHVSAGRHHGQREQGAVGRRQGRRQGQALAQDLVGVRRRPGIEGSR